MSEGSRLLIVDDEEVVLKSCQRVLRGTGHRIEFARSGEEGLEKLGAGHYDLVITDLKMPGMGGLELLKRIKERNPAQPVIVFTGFATVETTRESLKSGAFDYIPKPFTPEELRKVVENALQQAPMPTKMLDLMAIVAHEFKSPVSTVHTTADTLYGGYFGKLTPEQQKGLETIMRNCQYLEDIVRCFIDFSKVELDGLQFARRKLDLSEEVVRPVIEKPEYQVNLKQMGIRAELERTPSLPEVEGDPKLLQIVVNNLVNNAIKYGKAGTEIRIRLRREGDRAVLSVYNEGMGISREDIETRLFQRFGRLRQKGAEGIKGSGLGLYLSKTIVEKHGGRIAVESVPGKFAEFRVYFPS